MSEEKVKSKDELVPIFFMGKCYEVPSSLTIQKALEYAGYQLVRGCGCRGGICGACGTVFRYPDSYKIEVGLACQTVVQPNMYIAQLPFFPGNKATYNIADLEPNGSVFTALYPELYKCIGCGTCTRSCPMDIDVLGYMSKAIRGDIEGVAKGSFDCVMCGLCSGRCPAEEVQFYIAILARRLYALHMQPRSAHLKRAINSAEEGQWTEGIAKLKAMNLDTLKKVYSEREMEPHMGPEDWIPGDTNYVNVD
ncbi:4Fe-4S dicluster domain-containing protein [bacterium]|nr:4Fe-4S dicluster domain-containing protein [bacterium]